MFMHVNDHVIKTLKLPPKESRKCDFSYKYDLGWSAFVLGGEIPQGKEKYPSNARLGIERSPHGYRASTQPPEQTVRTSQSAHLCTFYT